MNESQHFVNGFLKEFLPNIRLLFFEKQLKRISTYFILLLLTIVLPSLGIITIYSAYKHNLARIEEVRNFVSEQNLGGTIARLSSITKLNEMLAKEMSWKSELFFFSFVDNDLSLMLKKARYQHIEARILPILVLFLEEDLDENCHGDDVKSLIEAFNIYLMIRGQQQFNHNDVVSWFSKRIDKILTFAGAKKHYIQEVLNTFDAEAFKSVKFDDTIYSKIERKFRDANFPRLIFETTTRMLREEEEFTVSDFSSQEFNNIFDQELIQIKIPYIYVRGGYNKYMEAQKRIFYQIIAIDHSHNILGNVSSLRTLIQQTNHIYVEDYILHWDALLSNIHLKRLNNLAECLTVLSNISLDVFPILEFSQLINRRFFIPEYGANDKNSETFPVQLSKSEYDIIYYKIRNAARYKLLDTHSLNHVRELFLNNARLLTQNIAGVLNSPDQGLAALNIIKEFWSLETSPLKQALEIVHTLPEPAASLYKELVDSIIDLLYEMTGYYIDNSLNEHILYWEEISSKISFDKSKNIDEYFLVLKEVSTDSVISQMFKFLQLNNKIIVLNREQTTQNEISIKPGERAYNATVQKIASIIDYDIPENTAIVALRTQFAENIMLLIQYVAHIANDQNRGLSAFNAIKEFENSKKTPLNKALEFAHLLPRHLSNFYQEITNNTVNFLYMEAYDYINQQWQQHPHKFYIEHLHNKYPFNKQNYSQQIDPSDFTRFFASNGVLDSFTKQYLSLKNVKISENASNFLYTAGMIRNSWFNKNGQLEIKFVITPIKIDDNISSIILDALNKKMEFSQVKLEKHPLDWLNGESDSAKVEFNDGKNKFVQYYEGVWSWYRILGLDNIILSGTTQKSILNSPLGNLEFSLSFGKKIFLFQENILQSPNKIVETIDGGECQHSKKSTPNLNF